jgi:AcrR family transcriptional regulator
MIALELNMSSGNLNYHFKKREDIFEALYFEMVLEFDERIESLRNMDL